MLNQNFCTEERDSHVEVIPRSPDWPTLGDEAFHGVLGDYVNAVSPHTEADPAALLFQTAAIIGNIVGRKSFVRAGGSEQRGNLFVVVVGNTGAGRKGESLSYPEKLASQIDPDWTDNCSASGLSSGEGLMFKMRDDGMKDGVLDPGVKDKRLLAIETELGSPLRNFQRDGNNLSAVLRNAWDSKRLSTLTRSNSLKATDYHFSLIGHITRMELTKLLSHNEIFNGFGNRNLWVFSHRSKYLPDGGSFDLEDHQNIKSRFRDGVEFGKSGGEFKRSEAAQALWRKSYKKLSDGKPGLYGAMVGRAEAQVVRLSLLYAILDCSREINEHHLAAAFAAWNYCDRSARFIFGQSQGDIVQDKLLNALIEHPEGLQQSQILHAVFKKNRSAGEIQTALEQLMAQHLVRKEEGAMPPTGGRAPTIWKAVMCNKSPFHICA